MIASSRISIGRRGEALAAKYLQKHGYTIIGRNLRTPYGEIDLLAQSGEVIVFVEVKTRASRSLGPPEISVTTKKQEHMRAAAEHYIQQHPELKNDWRFDVIAIQILNDKTPPSFEHFENVIT